MMKYAWVLLLTAILAEVLGTCAMKWGNAHAPLLGYAIMYAMIAVSYGLLSIAMKRIPLALSYAVWEGISLILITMMGVIFFDEAMSVGKLTALTCIVSGIFLLKAGTVAQDEHDQGKSMSSLEGSHVPIHT